MTPGQALVLPGEHVLGGEPLYDEPKRNHSIRRKNNCRLSHPHRIFVGQRDKITDQVERAIALGLDHICFTDHMDMDYPEGEFDLDTDAYVKRVLEVQEEYKDRIRICLGVELGMQEHLKERQDAYLAKYPFDFVIGSMHLIHGEDPYFGKIYEKLGMKRHIVNISGRLWKT